MFMPEHIQSYITKRYKQVPAAMRTTLVAARKRKGWSQAELGRRAGLTQVHISWIETGKKVPRVDTLLNLVRLLDLDLLIVPQSLVPMVQSMIRDYRKPADHDIDDDGERPLYEPDDEERE